MSDVLYEFNLSVGYMIVYRATHITDDQFKQALNDHRDYLPDLTEAYLTRTADFASINSDEYKKRVKLSDYIQI